MPCPYLTSVILDDGHHIIGDKAGGVGVGGVGYNLDVGVAVVQPPGEVGAEQHHRLHFPLTKYGGYLVDVVEIVGGGKVAGSEDFVGEPCGFLVMSGIVKGDGDVAYFGRNDEPEKEHLRKRHARKDDERAVVAQQVAKFFFYET
jgi:hypothetical protein